MLANSQTNQKIHVSRAIVVAPRLDFLIELFWQTEDFTAVRPENLAQLLKVDLEHL